MDESNHYAAIQLLETGYLPKDFMPGTRNESKRKAFSRQIRRQFVLEEDNNEKCLFKISRNHKQKVMCGDKQYMKQIVEMKHSTYNHAGISRLFYLVTGEMLINNVFKLCKEVVNECTTCQQQKRGNHRGPLKDTTEEVTRPGEKLQIDLVGPLSVDRFGNQYILMIEDVFSRKNFGVATKSKTSEEISHYLKRVLMGECSEYTTIQSDQGSEFVNSAVGQVAESFNIRLVNSRPYHPQSQGIVERLNSTIKSSVQRVISEKGADNWGEELPNIIHKYNNTPHRSLNFHKPAEVHNPSTRDQQQEQCENENFIEHSYNSQRQRFQQDKRNEKRKRVKYFDIGTVVLIMKRKRSKTDSSPLYPYRGVVIDFDDSHNYTVQYITKGMNGEKPNHLSKVKFLTEDLKEAKGILNTYQLLDFEEKWCIQNEDTN